MKRDALFRLTSAFVLILAASAAARAQGEQSAPKVEVGVQFTSLSLNQPNSPGSESLPWRRRAGHLQLYGHFAVEAEGNISYVKGSAQLRDGRRPAADAVRCEGRQALEALRPLRQGAPRLRQLQRDPHPRAATVGGCTVFNFERERKTHFSMDVGGVLEFYPSRRMLVRFDAGDTIIRYGEHDRVRHPPSPASRRPAGPARRCTTFSSRRASASASAAAAKTAGRSRRRRATVAPLRGRHTVLFARAESPANSIGSPFGSPRRRRGGRGGGGLRWASTRPTTSRRGRGQLLPLGPSSPTTSTRGRLPDAVPGRRQVRASAGRGLRPLRQGAARLRQLQPRLATWPGVGHRRLLGRDVPNPASSELRPTELLLDGRGRRPRILPEETLLHDDRTVRVWRGVAGERPVAGRAAELVGELQGRFAARVRALAFSHDGALLAGASDDRSVAIWDLRSHGMALLRGPSGPVRSVVFSHDDSTIAFSSDDGLVFSNRNGLSFVPDLAAGAPGVAGGGGAAHGRRPGRAGTLNGQAKGGTMRTRDRQRLGQRVARRLWLERETVRVLSPRELEAVAGGSFPSSSGPTHVTDVPEGLDEEKSGTGSHEKAN